MRLNFQSGFKLLCFLSIIASGYIQAQTRNYNIGDLINESIELTDAEGTTKTLSIPQNDYYTLVYRYRWVDIGKGIDTRDSIKALENKIAEMLLGGMVGKLKVICISYDTKTDFPKWADALKQEKLFSLNPKYKTEYYNTNGNSANHQKCNQLFSKLNLYGPDGKILKYSSSIGAFYYHSTNTNVTLKAKLLTEINGIKEPLLNALVHIAGKKNDTIAKARTDKYGDFELSFPNSSTDYNINVKPTDDRTNNVLLLTREGRQISKFQKNTLGTFEYKLLKADIVTLSEIESEDISMKYESFNASGEKELVSTEQIYYETGKSDLANESKSTLDMIVKILNDNPKVKLEIISHTDSQGDDRSNLKLSEARAKQVAKYLESKSVSAKRVKTKGMGEGLIRNRCTNGIECSDLEHRYNRRTEFRFIKP